MQKEHPHLQKSDDKDNLATNIMDKITVLQHNTLHWKTHKNNLILSYQTIDPDLILLNSHGVRNEETLKIYGYNTYKINSSNENNDGSAILIKNSNKT